MIKLDADETMLLLITKNWVHKDVPLENMPSGSLEYIQACCNYRVWSDSKHNNPNAHMFTIYIPLCIKLLSPFQFGSILEEIHKHLMGFWGYNNAIEMKDLMHYIISALAQRKVTDLELDESLMKAREEINA